MLTFIKKIVIGQKKIYITMIITLSFLACFEFILLSLYTSPIDVDSSSGMIIRYITTITVFVSVFSTLFINTYFVNSKTEEFSIILLSGRNLKQVLKYIIIQFGLLFLFTGCIGGVMGVGLLYGLNLLLPALGSEALFTLDFYQTTYIFVSLLLVKIVYVLVLNQGKFIRIKMDISDYMNHVVKKPSTVNYFSQFLPENTKKKFPLGKVIATVFTLFLIFTCLSSILSDTTDTNNLIVYFMISLVGEVSLLKSTLPLLYDILHDRILLKHPILLMALSQLIDVSKAMVSIININACLIPMMFGLLMFPFSSGYVETIIIVCYFIMMSIILLCFIVRFAVYLPTKAADIATLKAIGYQKKQIYRMQRIEILGFLLFIVGIPIIIYSFVLYKGYMLNSISMNTIFLLSGSYIVLYTLLCGYMIITYKRLTKEVLNDVKYLNRGE